MTHLTIKDIEAALSNADKETRLWDDTPRGLGLRITAGGVATFFIQYESPETFKKARFSIEQYGRITLNEARTEAKRLFQLVASGKDPAIEKRMAKHIAETAVTMKEFCDTYFKDAENGLVTYRGKPKKPSTIANDRGRIERHIKPLLGEKLVRDVTLKDVERMMHDIRLGKIAVDVKTGFRGRARVTGGAGTAARTVRLLGSIFTYAVKQGIRDDNPVRGVEIPPDNKRTRILTPDEYLALGTALSEMEENGIYPALLHAYWVLALTGCRRGEVFGLKKSEVDKHNQCLRFGDTKTGQQVRPVGAVAMSYITSREFDQESKYVFPAAMNGEHVTDARIFKRACQTANLEEVSLHTLRHSFASVALELEYSELTVGGMLGHRFSSITSRYAHHVDKALVAAADRVSVIIAERMDGLK